MLRIDMVKMVANILTPILAPQFHPVVEAEFIVTKMEEKGLFPFHDVTEAEAFRMEDERNTDNIV
jgi:hypothetical protein